MDPFLEGTEFAVGVDQRDVDPSPRSLPHVDFDHIDLGLAGLQKGSETLENDDVVVDERDPDGFMHGVTLRAEVGPENHPIG